VLTFFASDGRLFFVIPMGPVACIGTTDTRVQSPETAVSEADRRFVLDNINKRLRLAKPLTPADILAERCGVRPLAVSRSRGATATQDWTALSRKHVIELDPRTGYMSIFGGKLTDCLNVGREVSAALHTFGIRIRYPNQTPPSGGPSPASVCRPPDPGWRSARAQSECGRRSVETKGVDFDKQSIVPIRNLCGSRPDPSATSGIVAHRERTNP
jgi:hypothetical protein